MQDNKVLVITVIEMFGKVTISGHYTEVMSDERTVKHFEFQQPPLDDATDLTMWAQMAAARACDAL